MSKSKEVDLDKIVEIAPNLTFDQLFGIAQILGIKLNLKLKPKKRVKRV